MVESGTTNDKLVKALANGFDISVLKELQRSSLPID